MEYKITELFNDTENRWDVTLSGEVNIFGSQDFKRELCALADKQERDIMLDCAGLEYIDSTGLGALVGVLKRVKQYEGKVILVNLQPNAEKLFKITNLDRVFEIR